MQVIKEVIAKHGLTTLLQETPFADINGSRNVQQLVPLHRLQHPPFLPGPLNKVTGNVFPVVMAAAVAALDEHGNLGHGGAPSPPCPTTLART